MQKTYPLWPSYLEIWRIEKKLQLQENSITSLLSSACMSNWRVETEKTRWDSALTNYNLDSTQAHCFEIFENSDSVNFERFL